MRRDRAPATSSRSDIFLHNLRQEVNRRDPRAKQRTELENESLNRSNAFIDGLRATLLDQNVAELIGLAPSLKANLLLK
jgi:hypothetical protein